jgi:hypothetical protein
MRRTYLLLALALAGALLASSAADGRSTASSSLVVSQVYAGGGNSGASYANDFVELLDTGSASVDLSGWTVQYATATGTSWQTTALAGTVQPGRYYLVQLASGGTAGAALPTPDASGTTNLAASGGKIAVVHDTAALTCGATATSCSTIAAVVDLVGYGSATAYEGSGGAPSLDATTAAVRNTSGCTDSDDNASDFTAAAPTPRTSASAGATCGTGTAGDRSASQGTAVAVDVAPALAIAVERPSLSFGSAVVGSTPAAVSDHVTVTSNDTAGYALTVSRTAFSPADLPLAVTGSGPSGTQLAAALSGNALVRIPVTPASDQLLGSSTHASATAGDTWLTSIGFAAPIPSIPAGHYTATVTFTVVGQ